MESSLQIFYLYGIFYIMNGIYILVTNQEDGFDKDKELSKLDTQMSYAASTGKIPDESKEIIRSVGFLIFILNMVWIFYGLRTPEYFHFILLLCCNIALPLIINMSLPIEDQKKPLKLMMILRILVASVMLWHVFIK